MNTSATTALLATVLAGTVAAQDIELTLDRSDEGWHAVEPLADGFRGGAAGFAADDARIDVGPCPVDSREPFTLVVHLRTRFGGFCTPLMARSGEAVGISLVCGRSPGRISFEAWSWRDVRLQSQTRIDDGRWHRIEVTYRPATNRALLIIDGRPEASGRLGAGSSPNAVLRLGDNIGAHQPFPGDIDELSVRRVTTNGALLDAAEPVFDTAAAAAALARIRAREAERARRWTEGLDAPRWRERAEAVVAELRDALGLDPWPERRPLEPRVHGGLRAEGLLVERVSFATWPDYRATGWLWRPDPPPAGRLPAVLCPHGHWADGALHPTVQARCAQLARDGFVVLAVDSVHVEDVAAGVSSIGAMTWNNVRAVDLLAERDDVDPARIGVTGASGGAQQTMYLMALEPRLAAAAPICMTSYFGEILDDRSAHCGCNHAPRVGRITDEPELSAVFAPRPALFGTVTGDWTRRFPEQGWPELSAVWRLRGAPEAVTNVHLDAGHNYDRPFREEVYAFFARTLHGQDARPVERDFPPFGRAELLALGPPRQAPDRAALAREHLARRPRLEALTALAPALPWYVEPRAAVAMPGRGGGEWRAFRVSADDGVDVPFRLRERGGTGPVVVVAGPAVPALGAPWLEALPRVAIVEPRFSGEWSAFAAAWRRNGILLGCGEAYLAAHDIALVAAAIASRDDSPVRLVGQGSDGVSALIAACLSPAIESVVAPQLGALYAADGNRLPSAPELLRYGDLDRLVRELSGRVRIVAGGTGPAPFAGIAGAVVGEDVLDDDAIAAALR